MHGSERTRAWLATAWTILLTAATLVGIRATMRWLIVDYYQCCGCTLPTPTRLVIDAMYEYTGVPVALVPIALSVIGVWLRTRRPTLASVLVWIAPQLVWFTFLAAMFALSFPLLMFIPKCH